MDLSIPNNTYLFSKLITVVKALLKNIYRRMLRLSFIVIIFIKFGKEGLDGLKDGLKFDKK